MIVKNSMVDAMQKPDWKTELAPLFETEMVKYDENQFVEYCNSFYEQTGISDSKDFYNYLGNYKRRIKGIFSDTTSERDLFLALLNTYSENTTNLKLLMRHGANIHRRNDIDRADCYYVTKIVCLVRAGAIFKLGRYLPCQVYLVIDSLTLDKEPTALKHLVQHEREFFGDGNKNYGIFIRALIADKNQKSYSDQSTQVSELLLAQQNDAANAKEEQITKLSGRSLVKAKTETSQSLVSKHATAGKATSAKGDWLKEWEDLD